MIARIHFFSANNRDDRESGKKIWDNEMAPLLQKQKGFYKAFRADALDEADAGGVVLMFWESKQDEAAFRSNPEFLTVYRKLEPLIPELRIERDFEVGKEV